jgi:RHS repeat-associated protein
VLIRGSSVNKYFYISSPTGLCGIYTIEASGSGKLYHIFTDHLGSLTEIVDTSTGTVTRQSFDAWGNKRSASDWRNAATYNLFADRGFTGHEHLEVFALINMNGRVYDPVLGRFLSPDPYVQAPDFSQNFNRYSYCLNNPLVYTDPSGDFIFTLLAAIFCPPLIPLGIAADIGGGINLGSKLLQGKIHSFGDGVAAYGIGAGGGALAYATGGAALGVAGAGGFIGGAAAAGTAYTYGTMFTSMGNSAYFGDPMPTAKQFVTGAVISMATGGLFNGIVAATQGRDFWTGAAKIVPSNWQSPPLSTDIGDGNLSLDGMRPEIKALPDIQNQQTFLRVESGDGNVQWIRIEQQDLTLSPRQSLHLGTVAGKSPLTIDPMRALTDLNKGNFQYIQLNSRGMPIVKFGYNIGEVISRTGQNLGTTSFGVVHLNSAGQIHIVPWLPGW